MDLLKELEPLGNKIAQKLDKLNETTNPSFMKSLKIPVQNSEIELLKTEITQLKSEFFDLWRSHRVKLRAKKGLLIGHERSAVAGECFEVYQDVASVMLCGSRTEKA